MAHVKKRGNKYWYSRRIPKKLKKYYPDTMERVVLPLDTYCPKTAEQKSVIVNEDVENYWKQLVSTENQYSKNSFRPVLETAQKYGFTYKPSNELAEGSVTELINRLVMVKETQNDPELVKAKLGGEKTPSIPLSETLEIYWNLSKPTTMDMSEDQKRQWCNPRKRAIKNLISLIGDKSLAKLSRDDTLAYRDSWIMRIQDENLANNTANKEIYVAKGILEDVSEHLKLEIDVEHLFKKIPLPKGQKSERLPFEHDFIQNELLNPKNYEGVLEETKFILYAMADTGARPNEIIGLRPEDIILDDEIPHIKIREYRGRKLKTKYSIRDIPLVGCALFAFKQYPNGFEHYRSLKTGSNSFSGMMMQHLRRKNLIPSENHTIYSLRHSFQDRLTNLAVPDRAQCQLMGHQFKNRVKYGEGAYMKKLHEWLLQICFTPLSK